MRLRVALESEARAGRRVRGGPYGPPLPSEPGVRVSPHRAQALIRRREAPGDQNTATFTIEVCTGPTQSAHRAFNGANGNHRLRNHGGLAVPHRFRDPRPVGSQPPFGAGQQPLSGPLQSGIRLLRHPIPPCPRALPYGSPSTIPVGAVGLTTFRTCTIPEGRRPRLTAGSTTSTRGNRTTPRPACLPFGSCLSASLACCLSRRLNSDSRTLALSLNPGSRPP